ncbi:aminotransferase class I/II-fold pyridoxal phosphate-dependent enzyme [Eggerthia catenaformis]|uniref:aminotransferase class I/II-fold pyridoxal phosphate-dependent enzyme n=1 Tax=Eggerthia catenaformis TaxID=31973 RepID=UPI003C6F6C53
MKSYKEMNREEILNELDLVKEQYQKYTDMHLSLNMARGKPSQEQLDLSNDMLDILNSHSHLYSLDNTDCRNYGVLDGLSEAKALMADMMEVHADQIIIYGNSSLNVMYDTIARGYIFGVGGNLPFSKQEKIKWLCPAPGYDRHFGITESFGFELITIPMTSKGPDMDIIEKMVSEDESIKGIWCVPKFSNPEGIVYSDETVRRMASLKPKAKDFRIYWDNAYCQHYLYDEEIKILNILDECEKAGNPDMVYMFASTSKITFPGAGISALASSLNNKEEILSYMTHQTIGHDKLNQLRHVLFLKDIKGIKTHMKKHAAIIRPKFEAVDIILKEELDGLEIGSWNFPKGGYFISFDSLEGCASKIVLKAKEAGVIMTNAGATYPYGQDPKDRNIRIAPTLPPLKELKTATKLFTICVRLVSLEKLLNN